MFNSIANNILVTDLKTKVLVQGGKVFLTLLLALCGSLVHKVYATHLRAGEIIVRRVDCQLRTFEITVIVYTDTGSEVRFGEGVLDFGDGSQPFVLPIIENGVARRQFADGTFINEPIDVSGLGDEVSSASFTIEHTYSSALPFYTIGYTEQNRNDDIQNVDNNTPFHIETQISLDASLGCNNSPVLLIPPIDRACPGVAFFHNPGAFDPDNSNGERDSLAFELVIPKQSADDDVVSYIDVTDRAFYNNFDQANENMNGPPSISIDPITGELTWDAPGFLGEYTIAFVVREYRFRFGRWFPIGFVRRDMQIIVEDCDNERPQLIVPEDICVEAGTTIDETIFGTDPDGDNVVIDAFSEIFSNNLGGQVVGAGDSQPTVPPAEVQFTWETECLDVRDEPYQVVFRITDFPDEGPRLVSFATWNITVVGPSPQLTEVIQEGQGLRLNWESYECQNADDIQVWRRVDSNPYVPDECETGIRENAGYELITTLPDATTTFLDTNVDAAARYCYRLVASFSEGAANADAVLAESIVSDEVCFEFVPAETPIITHVSVRATDQATGEISVTWREPFELGNLTAPFTFRIYRSTGLSGTADEVLLPNPVVTSDTDSASLTIVDTGLNTLDNAYHYRVSIVDPSGTNGADEVFSAPASSVRLEATPQFGQIQLDWTAEVPWSNTITSGSAESRHIVFRGLEGDPQEDFEPLAEIDVSQSGFQFVDDDNLDEEQVYCYRILTRGTYGNPAIQGPDLDPLVNFSQVVCAQPSDSIPPCAPVLALEVRDCEQFINESFCNFDDYRNLLNWTTDFIGECQQDIREYRVFFAPTTEAEFELIATVPNETFIHGQLESFKGCYRIQAIDRSGNESEFSNVVCVDNCPNYILPNIFTPENDQFGNHLFRAYTEGDAPDPRNGGEQCARFVEAVEFTVYNRWGRPVFTYQGTRGSENGILINWDGKNDNGADLSSGVYYYLALVTFDTVDPRDREQEIKGWIQLIR